MMMPIGLTGNTRYRTNWRGKLILQVEEAYHSFAPYPEMDGMNFTHWRDARVEDLSSLKG